MGVLKFIKIRWFVLLLLLSTPVLSKEDKVAYEKKTTIDFEAKDVDGEFFRPDGQSVRGDKNLDFDSLMGPRNNFKKELKRSAGAIR